MLHILTILFCVYVLWRAKQEGEINSRKLRAVKETRYLRGRRRRNNERF